MNLHPRIGSVALTKVISGSFSPAINYFAHHRWTFKSDQRHLQSGVRYAIALFFLFLVNTALVKGLIGADVIPGIAKLAAAVIQTPVSYLVLKHMVFKIGDGENKK